MKSDYSLTGINASRSIELGLAEADWYQSPIKRVEMRKLLSRKDGPAIRDTLLLITILVKKCSNCGNVAENLEGIICGASGSKTLLWFFGQPKKICKSDMMPTRHRRKRKQLSVFNYVALFHAFNVNFNATV